ncbi:M14 family metallopeptidase [Maribacter antarcticus]|uniref:M14 family metallopeptidase n=1 Tax=Maribacter antarcticus TaxID=505250 RepID=UPI000684BABA|nr:M14 family metallopeptidase [Maribacter antarcticus]
MKNIFLIISVFVTLQVKAQTPKFQGQPPIKIINTESKPIQTQWKGTSTFKDSDIVFSNDFVGARLNGIVKRNDSTYTALITSENTPINISPWYAFKVWATEKKSINVVLTYQETVKHRYYPKLSSDGVHWSSLDSINYTEYEKGDADFGPGALPLYVKIRLEIGPDTLWVSGQELETSSRVFTWADSLSQKPFVQTRSIGKSEQGRDLNLLTVGDPESKNMLIVISRQHPPEVTGYLAMKAFVENLSSDSKLARKFRKKFTTYVIPLMNPDGVDNGHWRHNAGGIDLNRDWANFNQPETQAVKEFMQNKINETQGKFYFGIDFHSTWDDIYYTVDPKLKGNMPNLVYDWLDAIKKRIDGYDPNIKSNDKIQPTTVSRNYFFAAYGAEALVFEIGDNTPRPFIKEKGRISANVLMEMMLDRLKK